MENSQPGINGIRIVGLEQIILLSSMGSFDFVIVLTLIVKILDFVKGPTKIIQGRSLDLYDVVGVVRSARADLMFERNGEYYVFLRAASHTQQI